MEFLQAQAIYRWNGLGKSSTLIPRQQFVSNSLAGTGWKRGFRFRKQQRITMFVRFALCVLYLTRSPVRDIRNFVPSKDELILCSTKELEIDRAFCGLPVDTRCIPSGDNYARWRAVFDGSFINDDASRVTKVEN